MKNILANFLVMILVFIISANLSFAQNDSLSASKNFSIAQEMSGRLQQKILLSDEQTTEIKKFVLNFIEGKTDLTNSEELFSKIYPLLDDKQKSKFEIVRTDWLNSIIKEIKKSGQQQ